MNIGRVVLIATCVVIAGLGTWMVIAGWDNGDKIATSASALAAVAAVGVGIWAVLHMTPGGTSISATRTGNATTKHGTANTGLSINGETTGPVTVDRTGDAKSSDGHANTGVHQE